MSPAALRYALADLERAWLIDGRLESDQIEALFALARDKELLEQVDGLAEDVAEIRMGVEDLRRTILDRGRP